MCLKNYFVSSALYLAQNVTYSISIGAFDWQSYFLVLLTVWPQQFHCVCMHTLKHSIEYLFRVCRSNGNCKPVSIPERQCKYLWWGIPKNYEHPKRMTADDRLKALYQADSAIPIDAFTNKHKHFLTQARTHACMAMTQQALNHIVSMLRLEEQLLSTHSTFYTYTHIAIR